MFWDVFLFQAEDGIRDGHVTGVQTCALPICSASPAVITAKMAEVTSNGTASPRLWASAPEIAGPATPPTPALATEPPSAFGPPAAAPASQHRPAVHTMPYPAPNASRAASRAGKP